MTGSDLLILDYFTGGIPAGMLFLGNVNHLKEVVANSKAEEGNLNTSAEVCFIGLISYFESFCKSHFASLINICPQLLSNLKGSGQDIKIDATDLFKVGEHPEHKIGFLISEGYDFGTSKKINAIFNAILKISPFSKYDARRFDRILNDRNLIVHHGGIYTVRYSEQIFAKKQIGKRVHMDSLVIGKKYFFEQSEFLENIAIKTIKASQAALTDFTNREGNQQTESQREAIDALTWDY